MKKEEFDNKKKLVYDFVTDKEYKPMSVKEMAMVLQVPAAEKKDLRRVVEALCEEGKIHISQRGKVRPLALWQHRKGLDLSVLREKRRTTSSRRIR